MNLGTQKPPRVFLDGLPLVWLPGGVLRRAALDRGLCSLLAMGRTASKALCALPVCRANDPDNEDALPAMVLIKPALLSYRLGANVVSNIDRSILLPL